MRVLFNFFRLDKMWIRRRRCCKWRKRCLSCFFCIHSDRLVRGYDNIFCHVARHCPRVTGCFPSKRTGSTTVFIILAAKCPVQIRYYYHHWANLSGSTRLFEPPDHNVFVIFSYNRGDASDTGLAESVSCYLLCYWVLAFYEDHCYVQFYRAMHYSA